MESVPGHRSVFPRALFRRIRKRATAFEQSCPAALFLAAAVTAVLSVRGDGFPYVLIPAVSVLLVWALIPVRDALFRFALPMLPVLISALIWSGQQRNMIAETAGRARGGRGSPPKPNSLLTIRRLPHEVAKRSACGICNAA